MRDPAINKKILIIFGTRPEVIKLAPIISEAKSSRAFHVSVLATAQHRQMLDQTLSVFSITPDYDLDLMMPNQSLSSICSRIIAGVDDVLTKELPDAVVVQGDTVTTFASALAAYYRKIKVAHVEAGLRSHDRFDPFPEEINRALISRFADFNFCPTEGARQNLLREGVDGNTIFVTGNTVVDTLIQTLERPYVPTTDVLSTIDPKDPIILLTTHRRESFGKPMENVFRALRTIADSNPRVHVVFPVHPNPNVRDNAAQILAGHERIHLISPVPYLEFVHLLKRAHLIVSDSGGICEEAPTLGKPVLLIRNVTERPEAIASGTARLVGTDPKVIIEWVGRLLNDPDEYKTFVGRENPFGDGTASRRIVSILKERL